MFLAAADRGQVDGRGQLGGHDAVLLVLLGGPGQVTHVGRFADGHLLQATAEAELTVVR